MICSYLPAATAPSPRTTAVVADCTPVRQPVSGDPLGTDPAEREHKIIMRVKHGSSYLNFFFFF